MSLVWLSLGALGASLLAWGLMRVNPDKPVPAAAKVATKVTMGELKPLPESTRPGTVLAAAAPTLALQPMLTEHLLAEAPPLPEALATFHWHQVEDLSEDQRANLLDTFHHIPRPPRLMHLLSSPDFLRKATSTQLAELVVGEPMIAAKVLSTVNSPAFGLTTPVTSLGHAISFLGLTTVRNLCMQYLMANAFKADTPVRQKHIDTAWNASVLASELAQRLALLIRLPDPGSLVTSLVLSFLGRLATVSVMPEDALTDMSATDLLARTRAEQDHFGLSSGQIGSLLLTNWELPESIVHEVRAIEQMLVGHPPATNSAEATAQVHAALCYLCARIGEQLASGELADLADFDLEQMEGPDWHHVRLALRHPAFATLNTALTSSEVLVTVRRMQQAH